MPSAQARHPGLGKLAAAVDRCLIERKADRIGSARALLTARGDRIQGRGPGPCQRRVATGP